MAHLSKLERGIFKGLMELQGQPVSMLPQSSSLVQSQLATTCGQFDTVCIPGSCCPVKDSKRKRQRILAVPAHMSMHAHMHSVTTESSAHTDVCGRGLTGQAVPALCPSQTLGLLSFPRSKHPEAPVPFKTLQSRQYMLRQIWWRAGERI